MEFQEFIKSRFCRPLVLAPEDEVQDITEWRRLVREDQERQFQNYSGASESTIEKTDEERRVERFLAEKILPVNERSETPKPDPLLSAEGQKTRSVEVLERLDTPTFSGGDSRSGQKFNKVKYQREYMRKRRAAHKAK